ncbi:hypothetical protein OIO90_005004 [Microbotryomycetes sp. JL221]|nr:hypothetical protein OIO90_005004 [Microbotryomycetes sp. JL221]
MALSQTKRQALLATHVEDDSATDSDSDEDGAPEEVSLSTAKSAASARQQLAHEQQQREAQLRKDKNRARDQRLKLQATQAKDRRQIEQQAAKNEQDQLPDDEEDEDAQDEDAEDDDEPPLEPVASTSAKKINYLDDSLFASAAEYYKPPQQPAAGQGKTAQKRAAREARRQRGQAHRERAQQIAEGGSRTVGDVTMQHLPSSANKAQSLATTALPSHTSANKFITSRLYSKKRQLAVLDAGKPRTAERSDKKRKKSKSGGGMSEESKKLLGLGMDDGSREKEAAEEKEKNRKRSLLLQAEGKRRSATIARPLASSRSRGGPAANFAISSRTR